MLIEIFQSVADHLWVIAPSALTGLGGWAGCHYTARMNVRIAREARQQQVEAAEKTREEKQDAADQAQADNLTQRFQTLMDGYEVRIKDLTGEVQILREENRNLTSEVRLLHKEITRLRESIDNAPA